MITVDYHCCTPTDMCYMLYRWCSNSIGLQTVIVHTLIVITLGNNLKLNYMVTTNEAYNNNERAMNCFSCVSASSPLMPLPFPLD